MFVIFENAVINNADKNALNRQLDAAREAGITEVKIYTKGGDPEHPEIKPISKVFFTI